MSTIKAMKIHKRLKFIREAYGFTLADVESKTKINISLLRDIERGKKDITVSQLVKLSKLYNKPFSDFFEPEKRHFILWKK